MKSLTALETLRRRQLPQAASDEQFFRDRQAYDEEDAYFAAELARETCVTPENCEVHIWARCGEQRPDVIRALKNEQHRRSDPLGYADAEAAKQVAKERRALERREKAIARKAERKAEKERRHAQAIADARAATDSAPLTPSEGQSDQAV